MPLPIKKTRELPPTAGLPLTFNDLYATPPSSLALGLQGWLDIPPPILTCSGTAALIVALTTLRRRFPTRRRVIIPAYTCPLVPLAKHFVPETEILTCDPLPGSIDMDPELLVGLCDERTLAVVVTHLGGRVADAARAVAIAHTHGAMVIEDAAQAMGARHNGESVGLAGDIGFFSLAAGKGLTTYEGGVLFSKEPELHALLARTAEELLPAHVWWNARRIAELFGYVLLYNPSGLRLAYGRPLRKALEKRDEIQAVGDYFAFADILLHRPDSYRLRVAANALVRLPDFLEQGTLRAKQRMAALSLGNVRILDDAPGQAGTWPFLMVLMPGKKERDEALARLWRGGLGVSKLFVHALADYPFLAPFLSREANPGCPQARNLADRMLTVTNTPWLDDATFQGIVKEIHSCM